MKCINTSKETYLYGKRPKERPVKSPKKRPVKRLTKRDWKGESKRAHVPNK